jgi:hypothetical protein
MTESTQTLGAGVRKWMIIFGLSLIISIGLPIWYATWDVTSYAHHSCQALEVLTATPVKAPVSAKADPSREQTYRLYQGLVYWEKMDGC